MRFIFEVIIFSNRKSKFNF